MMYRLRDPLSLLWLAVKLACFFLLYFRSVDLIVIAYQRF